MPEPAHLKMLAVLLLNMPGETWNAIIVAVIGSISAFVIARYHAKRDAGREDVTEGRAFRTELRDDNQNLRTELRELKEEQERLRRRLEETEEELYKLQTERRERQRLDKEDALQEARGVGGEDRAARRESRQLADLATDVRQDGDLSDPHGERNPTADAIVTAKNKA